MASSWGDNFEYKGTKPDFTRQQYDTIADMKAVKKAQMPAMYIGFCLENHKIYTYDKTNEVDETLGLWREFSGGSGETIQVTKMPTAVAAFENRILQFVGETDSTYTNGYFYKCTEVDTDTYVWVQKNVQPGDNNVNSKVTNLQGFMENLFDMERRISELERANNIPIKMIATSEVVFNEGNYVKNFLPFHERSQFVRTFTFEYKGEVSNEFTDVIKINNKTIEFENIGSGSGETIVKFEAEIDYASNSIILNRYINNSFLDFVKISDSFILTFEINSTLSNLTCTKFEFSYYTMDYLDVDLDYPFPVVETEEGEVHYESTKPTGAIETSLGHKYNLLACYTLGNTSTNIDNAFNQKNKYPDKFGIQYVYMANWYWLKNVTSASKTFTPSDTAANCQKYGNRIKRLDFSKIKFDKLAAANYILFYYAGSSVSTHDILDMFNFDLPGLQIQIQALNATLLTVDITNRDWSNVSSLQLGRCCKVKTFGDFSNFDTSNFTRLEFSSDYYLENIGDVSNWNLGNITSMNNIFKGDFNLKLPNNGLKNWRFPNATGIAWIFESCMNIGDEELNGLGEWEVGNVTDFRGPFSYNYEEVFKDGGYIKDFYDANRLEFPTIQHKRTDLSFIENWDMSSATKLEGFAANNPYLVNIGDLRKWTLNSSSDMNSNGFKAFLMNCSALETFKMPSIPNGANVTDIVKGCTSLANIEVNELNVAAISFEDCPLTKQSILNLINAATVEVSITLKGTVYDAYASDSDVVAAIAAKASSNITVSLVRAE